MQVFRRITAAAFWAAVLLPAFAASAATLLPNGKQTFLNANGTPLAGGFVYFYIPNTSTPKNTYQDPGSTILNTNPVILDAAGSAIIYGSGTYREVVTDASGNLIWDQLTADTSAGQVTFGGVSTGSANVQNVSAPSYSLVNGAILYFYAGFTNTSSVLLNVNGTGGIAVYKDTTAGPQLLTGNEIVLGNGIGVVYDSSLGAYHLLNTDNTAVLTPGIGASTAIVSGATVDLGTILTHNANITGTSTIVSFGANASLSAPIYFVTFSSSLTLTYNAASLILPGAANITTAANDFAIFQYLGSGNWLCLTYVPASGQPAVPVAGSSLVTGKIFASGGLFSGGVLDIPVPSDAQEFEIEFINATQSGTANLQLQYKVGGSLVSSGYYGSLVENRGNAMSGGGVNGGSVCPLNATSVTSTGATYGTIKITGAQNNSLKGMFFNLTYNNIANSVGACAGTGNTGLISDIIISLSSGSFTGGGYRAYKIK